MSPARANSSRATATERLVLIPDKNSTTGYKNVTYNRSCCSLVAALARDANVLANLSGQ